MQTNEITDQLCPKQSGSACWQCDPGYRVNSPLDPHLYQALNTTHRLLNDTNPQLARDCWFCLSLGAPCYLAIPIPLNNATAMGTPIDPPLQGPVLRTIELTQKAPECFTNDGGTEPVGHLAMDQCNQAVKGEWPSHSPTNTIWCRPIKAFSLWDRCLLMSTSQLDGYPHLSFPHSLMNTVPNSQTLTVPLTAHP